jgi:hypothetical protein
MPWLRTGKTNAKSLKTVFTGYGIEYHPCHVNGRRNLIVLFHTVLKMES